MGETAFGDLRRLADWFNTVTSSGRSTRAVQVERLIERLIERLGATCIPLLGRELAASDVRRRDAARAALAHLARSERARVLEELRRVAEFASSDEGKVCALGLLAELGERAAARFSDPGAMQRRSAFALAAELETPADVAAAADMMITTLEDDAIVSLLDVMGSAAPDAAARLSDELCVRLDLPVDVRDRISQVATSSPEVEAARSPEPEARGPSLKRAPRPTHVVLLVDAAARLVIVATRKLAGERKWRRWALLLDADGRIEDCLYEDRADDDAATLVEQLLLDGYRAASSDLDKAREIVITAARITAEELDSAYYLGRDLLDLGDAHMGGRAHPASNALGRAIELLADGDLSRARMLLARCTAAAAASGPHPPAEAAALAAEIAATTAACLLAEQRHAEAVPHLVAAIEQEPSWPLHHWNLAAAHHALGDARACYQALRRFVATSAQPSGLYADPDQPGRVALAERLMQSLERAARLTGTRLTPPRKRKRR